MGSRKQVARFGAVLAGAAITVMGTAFPAFASTTGTVDGHDVQGAPVVLDYVGDDGKPVEQQAPTALIGLKLADNKEAATYCVELDVDTKTGAPMDEVPWDKYPRPANKFTADSDKVNWILHNSFPTVADLDALAKKSGAAHLDKQEAIAGTQAAIWHFSNGANLAKAEKDADVTALYGYLTGPANTGIKEEPKPTLTITPDQLKGHAGDKIGPFTVETTATSGTITVTGPSGIKILDENGNPIPGQTVHQNAAQAQAKGTTAKFYIGVPANLQPGTATVKIDGEATLLEGRLFAGHDVKTQTLIIAQSEVVKVSAQVSASWTAVPVTTTPTTPAPTTSQVVVPPTTPSKPGAPLANTGVSVWPMVGVAGVLLAGGAGALLLQRRRGNASE